MGTCEQEVLVLIYFSHMVRLALITITTCHYQFPRMDSNILLLKSNLNARIESNFVHYLLCMQCGYLATSLDHWSTHAAIENWCHFQPKIHCRGKIIISTKIYGQWIFIRSLVFTVYGNIYSWQFISSCLYEKKYIENRIFYQIYAFYGIALFCLLRWRVEQHRCVYCVRLTEGSRPCTTSSLYFSIPHDKQNTIHWIKLLNSISAYVHLQISQHCVSTDYASVDVGSYALIYFTTGCSQTRLLRQNDNQTNVIQQAGINRSCHVLWWPHGGVYM